jgi:hypothetical protein
MSCRANSFTSIVTQRINIMQNILAKENHRAIDLTGHKFGKLTAIEYKGDKTPSGERMWVCKCECGNTKIVQRKHLRNGFTTSCGCLAYPSGNNHSSWKGYGEISSDFFSTIKRNAVSRDIEFDVTIEYLYDLLLKQNKRCALSGVELYFGRVVKDKKSTTASLDRINSSKGYLPGNVQWVHKRVNIMKNNMDEKDFIEFCKCIVEHNKTKI